MEENFEKVVLYILLDYLKLNQSYIRPMAINKEEYFKNIFCVYLNVSIYIALSLNTNKCINDNKDIK